jgi:hypothetical protein
MAQLFATTWHQEASSKPVPLPGLSFFQKITLLLAQLLKPNSLQHHLIRVK